jgi:hypothetical protein
LHFVPSKIFKPHAWFLRAHFDLTVGGKSSHAKGVIAFTTCWQLVLYFKNQYQMRNINL